MMTEDNDSNNCNKREVIMLIGWLVWFCLVLFWWMVGSVGWLVGLSVCWLVGWQCYFHLVTYLVFSMFLINLHANIISYL